MSNSRMEQPLAVSQVRVADAIRSKPIATRRHRSARHTSLHSAWLTAGRVLAAGLWLIGLIGLAAPASADDSHGSQPQEFEWLLELRVDDGRLQLTLGVAPEQSARFQVDSQSSQLVNELTRTAARDLLADSTFELDESVVALSDHLMQATDESAIEPANNGIESGRFAQFIPVLEYALDIKDRPERLRLLTHGSSDEPASIAVVVFHRNVLLNSPVRLTPTIAIQLDWLDAWQSRMLVPDASRPVDIRHQLFLTRDGDVIRCEVLRHARLQLDDTNSGEGMSNQVSAEQQQEYLQRLERDCHDLIRLEVNGEQLAHSQMRADIVEAVPDGLIRREPDRDRLLDGLLLGCRWVVPLSADQRSIQINCSPVGQRSFNGQIHLRDADESRTIKAERSASLVNWPLQPGPPPRLSEFVPDPLRERLLNIPLAGATALLGTLFQVFRWWRARVWSLGWLISTLGLVALTLLVWPHATKTIPLGQQFGSLDRRAEFAEVCRPLLANVYLASEDSSDSNRFDRLAEFVAPELRDRVFLAIERSRRTRDPFEQLHVDQVEVIDVEHPQPDGSNQFRAHCRWQVSGWIFHWGHKHQIQRQAEADVWIGIHGQQWKLARIEMSAVVQPPVER